MSLAALRASARIAWRQARRAPGRGALVVAMIAMPIAALTLGVTLIRTSVPTMDERIAGEMGSADLKAQPDGATVDSRMLESVLPPGSRVVLSRQWSHTMVVNGTLVFASVWETSVPIDQAPIPGLYVLMDGRAPATPGEVSVDPRVLEIFGVGIGDMLEIGERSFRVVGVAARPAQMWDAYVVAAPGTLEGAPMTGTPAQASAAEEDVSCCSVLVDLPQGADAEQARRAVAKHLLSIAPAPEGTSDEEIRQREDYLLHEAVSTREGVAVGQVNDAPVLTGVAFAGAVGVLFGTGLIAAAAFAVGIRRQLRMLGLVGATGAEPAHVRAIVLLSGTSLGLVGSGLGVAVGVAGAYAITPHLSRFTHALPGDVLLHPPTFIGAALLGVVAATAAAAWPGRLAARISTLDALAARMPPPRPTGRLARRGLIGVAVGAVLTGSTARPGGNQAVLGAGLVLMLGGFLVAVPYLLSVAGRLAPALPTAPRLAVRETARNGRRTGTAIAAAAIALTLPVGTAALSLSEEAFHHRTPYLGAQHLLLGSYTTTTRPSDELLADIRRVLPGAIMPSYGPAYLDLERYPPPPSMGTIESYPARVEGRAVKIDGPGGGASYRESGQLIIGGPDLLRAVGARDGIRALRAGKVVGIGPDTIDGDVVYLELPDREWDPTFADEPRGVKLPAVEAGAVAYFLEDQVPRYVLSPEGAAALGIVPGPPSIQPSGTLVAAQAPLTQSEIQAVKDVVSDHPGAYVQTLEDFIPRLGPVRLAVTGGAALIALAIVAVVVALLGAEARRDQAILVAVGASPRARRRIVAARAGLVALLAGVIAVPAGFAPIAVIQWSRVIYGPAQLPDRFPIVVPWSTMALVAFAVPLVAALFAAMTSRAPKASAMLQPIH